MKILDFLFYYLTNYFSEHKDRYIWSTPLEWATYVIGVITLLWIISISEITEIFIIKRIIIPPELIFICGSTIAGLALIQFYKYIYVNRKRYQIISSKEFKSMGDIKRGKVVSIVFVIFSFILPCIVFILLD